MAGDAPVGPCDADNSLQGEAQITDVTLRVVARPNITITSLHALIVLC
jgi:hypothetical protein